MKTGVVAHLFWRGLVLLVLRDELRVDGEQFADPGCWDSVTETMEPEDAGDFLATVKRGCLEELSIIPRGLSELMGTTRKGHGFFCGVLTDCEVQAIKLSTEGQAYGFFNLEALAHLDLGGAIKWHLKAYPEAFQKMARGTVPTPSELGLQTLVLSKP